MNNPAFDSIEPLLPLLPLRSVVITLNVLAPINIGMLHHVPLHAWLRTLAGSPEQFSQAIVIDPIENGHYQYHTGDKYRFRLTVTPIGVPLLNLLLNKLQALPKSAQGLNPKAVLHSNMSLHSIHDGISHQPYRGTPLLSPFGLDEIAEQLDEIEHDNSSQTQSEQALHLRFVTPALLKKNQSNHTGRKNAHQSARKASNNRPPNNKGLSRFCRNASDLDWTLFTQRLSDSFINLITQHNGKRFRRPEWPQGKLTPNTTIWMEYRYGRELTQKKAMGGMLSQVSIITEHPLAPWQWAILILGQYLGMGQSRAFGFGLYQIDSPNIAAFRPPAAVSLLALSYTPQRIETALQHANTKSDTAGKSHSEWQATLNLKASHIQQGQYTVPPLTPVEIARPDGSNRQLYVPPLEDRMLQRAMAQFLSATFETHWIKRSYGYRAGHSRFNAKDEINRLIQQGYTWIVEADIEKFFDNICWDNLYQRLQLLFPHDPIIDMIMQWVTAPIQQPDGTQTARNKGLPQGAPLSPLLANLILDDFDADMINEGYELVRYADDFVLLFKHKADAEKALEKVHTSLNEHQLQLNPQKTCIVSKSQGFKFLGFFFIDGYAIESKSGGINIQPANDKEQKTVTANPPCNATLNNTSLNNTSEQPISALEQRGIILTIANEVALLSCHDNKLQILQEDKTQHVCWQSLECIVLMGPHQITTPTLHKAMRHHIPVYFISRFGEFEGVTAATSPEQGGGLWLQQVALFQQQDWALEQSKQLVHARIAGITKIIYRRQPKSPLLNKLTRIQTQLLKSNTLAMLRGYEGQASKLLWQFYQESLDSEWQFNGRNRRPPRDPVNALLSLGYTLLHNLTDSAIRVAGLYPWQGMYHQPHGNHAALASDLIEPMRFIVERVVLTLINRLQIKPTDFQISEQGCSMSANARKVLLTSLLQALTQPRPDKPRYLDDIFQQPRKLAQACRLRSDFKPWRP